METNLTAYEQGIQACKDGVSIFDAPYRFNTKACEEWMDGFMYQDHVVIYGY